MPEASQKKNAVLIVEDDVFLAGILGRKLQEKNFKIYQAPSAEQARSALEVNLIDLICLDISLPGVDGLAFLKELKGHAQFKDIPVLIISNLGQQEEIERGIQAGAADYVIKANTSPAEIAQKVKELIKK